MSLIERIFLFTLIAILLLAIAKIKYADYRKKHKQKKRFERGNMLETQAKSFLENKGYQIIEEQKVFYHSYEVNNENRNSKLIVDYIVEKKGKKYIVEVKSGKSAISLNDKNSRRQLLEYDFVIENDGVFLLDMENKNMQFVKFKTKAEKKEDVFRKIIIVLAGVAIIIPSWTLKFVTIVILLAIWFYPVKARNIILTLIPIN